jgi:peptide/nickel transport system substrate-binding protein
MASQTRQPLWSSRESFEQGIMKFTKSLWLAAISACAAPALLPGPGIATKHPNYGGTLRVELSASTVSLDPRTWKPGSATAADGERLAALLYDRLVTLDDYGRFQPALAAEWSHDATAKIWQFKLRPGVTFSDGSPLMPKEVVAALQPLLPGGVQIMAAETGVQIRAAHPTPDLLEQLASGRYFIFRAQPNNSILLGTGPFVLAENSAPTPAESNPSVLRPAHLKFRARDDGWSGRPFVDSIDVTLGNPPLRQLLDLQVGHADIVDISPDLVRKARQENLRVWSSPPYILLALRLDEAQHGTADPRLREALDLALDRDTMANVLLQRQAFPAVALLPQWLSGYAFLFGAPMNLDRAKALRTSLSANSTGVSEPLRLRIDTNGDLMKLLGERVAVNARQANITIQVVPRAASASASATAPPIGAHLFAWHYDSLSPRAELQSLAQFLASQSGGNSESIEEPIEPEKLYAQEKRLLDERQILPLLLLPEYVGLAPNIRNWTADPSGAWQLADVWLESAEPAASHPEGATGRSTAPGVHP